MAELDAPVLSVRSTGSPSTGTARLKWTAVPGAESYKVFYGTSPNPTSRAPQSPLYTGTTAYITGLTLNTRYYFRVVAQGAELAVNGDFATDIDGWATVDAEASVNWGGSAPNAYLYMDLTGLAENEQCAATQLIPITEDDIGKTCVISMDSFGAGGQGLNATPFAILYAYPSYAVLASNGSGRTAAFAYSEDMTADAVIPEGTTQLQVFLVYVADQGVAVPAGAAYPVFDNVHISFDANSDYSNQVSLTPVTSVDNTDGTPVPTAIRSALGAQS